MSFGFSPSDILGGASLAYKLCTALSGTNGSARDYQELIAELNVVHKVLLQVEELRVSNQLAQATLNALLFATNSANEAMEVFLADHEKYNESLKQGGSGNVARDSWMKIRWATQMKSEQAKLRQTLTSMLASINCLVQLACFFNSGCTPDVDAKLLNKYDATSRRDEVEPPHTFLPPFNDVKCEARIWDNLLYSKREPIFKVRPQPIQFFRSGQVFSLCISAGFLVNRQTKGPAILSEMSLEPLAVLSEKYERIRQKNREKRLKQILSLPLAQMIQYTKDGGNGKVWCTLCRENTGDYKDTWADTHFRLIHWRDYCEMRGITRDSGKLPSIASYFETSSAVPTTQPISTDPSHIMPADWISLKDITSDAPIREDWEIEVMANGSMSDEVHLPGPTMIRRFVVIQEGPESCLCLGIHTYAGLGCSTQVDQELFAILHSSKEVPAPFEEETGIVLHPIRMKPEHPSTALPMSSRIHFGRAYEVRHDIPVKSIGLIHAGSMEKLIAQSEAHIYRGLDPSNRRTLESGDLRVAEEAMDLDIDVNPANTELVKSMRHSIKGVLGKGISLSTHPSRTVPLVGIDTILEDSIDSESSQETKRARIK